MICLMYQTTNTTQLLGTLIILFAVFANSAHTWEDFRKLAPTEKNHPQEIWPRRMPCGPLCNQTQVSGSENCQTEVFLFGFAPDVIVRRARCGGWRGFSIRIRRGCIAWTRWLWLWWWVHQRQTLCNLGKEKVLKGMYVYTVKDDHQRFWQYC